MDGNGGGGGGELAPAIGIDLGTTYSCVGVWQRGKVEIIVNGQGNRTTPSFVAFTDSEKLVGDAAKNQVARNPNNTVYDVKRLIGKRFSDAIVQSHLKMWPFKVVAGNNDNPMIVVQHKGKEKRLAPEDISSMVLAYMREIAEVYLGTKIKNAVVTVPAYFSNSQRQATKDAGAKAGLKVMRVINEPTAAAIAHGLNEKTGGDRGKKNVLIFDLGGGTFDVSLISIDRGKVKVIATAGDSHLGGVDFDSRLVNHCVREFERRHNKDIRGDPKALRKLRTACERAKRTLSHDFETAIEIECLHEGIDLQCSISCAKFEDLNMDLFNRCMELVKQCLKDAGMGKDTVNDVVLVGGSTRILKVQELLREFFHESKICKGVNPDEAVACGAAINAAILGGQESMRFEDLVLRDVTPLPLGIGIVGGLMSVIIPKNTTIPVKMEKVFTTSFDNQTTIDFAVYEGERTKAKENNLLGEFELSGIPPMPKLVPEIPVWFEIDADGILVVSAEDLENKGKAKITITRGGGWTTARELNDVVIDTGNEKMEQQFANNIEARMKFEKYAIDLRKIINGNDGTASKLAAKDVERIEDAIEKALAWSRNNQTANADEFEAKRTELELTWSAVITQVRSTNAAPQGEKGQVSTTPRRETERRFWETWPCCLGGGTPES